MARNTNYENMMEANAAAPHRPKAMKSEVEHVRIYKGENGGHILENHMKSGEGMRYEEPKKFPIGKGGGKEIAAHLNKHMGIEMGAVKDDEDSAAGAAS